MVRFDGLLLALYRVAVWRKCSYFNKDTGALHEKSEIDNVVNAINDPEKVVVVGVAPSVRVALGEEFGYPIGTNVEGKMVTALKMLQFDHVFDVNLTADLTILEEANELVERITSNGTLPAIIPISFPTECLSTLFTVNICFVN